MRKALTGGVLGAALCLTACTVGDPLEEPAPVDVTTVTETAKPTSELSEPSEPSEATQPKTPEKREPSGADVTAELTSAVDQVVAAHGGTAAVSMGESTAGDASSFASWSTMKVPVAIAALKEHPEMTVEATNAIEVSDNGAADMLWNATTPEAVEAVLAEGGAPVTVERNITRPGFSAFGQTQWSVADQARFASNLGCVAGSGPVLEMMGNVAQNYGLGTIPGARFKGGWGPSISGAYEVRQLGLVPDAAGRTIPVAIAASAADGTYESAQVMLTQLVTELGPALNAAPEAACT